MPTDNGHLSCLLHCEASRLLRKKIFRKKMIKCENLNQLIGFNSPYNCVHCVWKELINDLNLSRVLILNEPMWKPCLEPVLSVTQI